MIFDGDQTIEASNINPYLLDAPNVLIESRAKPLSPDAPRMTHGNKPVDDGNLILSQDERDQLLKRDPKLECCIRRYLSGRDFINGDDRRYCLWLKDVEPGVWQKNREIMRRVDAVQKFRAKSTAKPTREKAAVPFLFFSAPQTDADYLCIPEVSSERRKYIPIGFMDRSIIASAMVFIVSNARLYHFGVLTSSVHMSWMRVVGGRLEMSYRYSTSIVYNTFPWCTPTDEQRDRIEHSARSILEARSHYPNSSLASLYDDRSMPLELRRAHLENDRAVLDAYGFDRALDETEIVARLMTMYQSLTIGGNL